MDEDRPASADALTEEEQERQHLLAVIEKRRAHLKCLEDECVRWEANIQELQQASTFSSDGNVIPVFQAESERLRGELEEAEIERKNRKAALQQQIEEIEQERSRINAKMGECRQHTRR